MAHATGFRSDLPCDVCGYNLRGLSPGGACPECGLPIESSRPRTLVFWPTAVRHALAVVFGGLLLALMGRGLFIIGLLFQSKICVLCGVGVCAVGAAVPCVTLPISAAASRRSNLVRRAKLRWRLVTLAAACDLVFAVALLLLLRTNGIPSERWLWLAVVAAVTGAAAGLAWGGFLAGVAEADVNHRLGREAAALHRFRAGVELGVAVVWGILAAFAGLYPLLIVVGCASLVIALAYVLLLPGVRDRNGPCGAALPTAALRAGGEVVERAIPERQYPSTTIPGTSAKCFGFRVTSRCRRARQTAAISTSKSPGKRPSDSKYALALAKASAAAASNSTTTSVDSTSSTLTSSAAGPFAR